ncbi:MAG: hypothetical protein NZL89_02265 [Leptospiraceae bacterium]|nr:hypothetical protein [Leptospiraceae bacterium]
MLGHLSAACKEKTVLAELDASFQSIEEVFPQEFRNEQRELEKNTELTLGAKNALSGRYGTLLSADAWEFSNDADCRNAYETLVALEKEQKPREFQQTHAQENRYRFTRQTAIAGEIFTLGKALFRILATDKETIAEYLVAAKLARLR